LIAGKVRWWNGIYQTTGSASALSRFGAHFSLSLINQLLIATPFYWHYVARKKLSSLKSITAFGFCSGLLFGLTPAAAALIGDKWQSFSGNWSIGAYGDTLLLNLVTISLLTGFWGGITATFVGLAAEAPQFKGQLIATGLALTGLFAGLTSSFLGSVVAWLPAVFSAICFVGYLRVADQIKTKLQTLESKSSA
jgi:hypothetical protein